MKNKRYSSFIIYPSFFIFFLFFVSAIHAQQQAFTGLFVNRDGLIEVVSMLGGPGYQLEVIKNGERFAGEAKDIGGGNLEGTYLRGKEKVPFTINYEKGFYFFSAENASIPLMQHVTEYNQPSRVQAKKSYTDHRFATGARVFDSEGKFAFNLPDDAWTYTGEDDKFTLQKEDLAGWIKIYTHDLASFEAAKEEGSVAAFLKAGHFEEAMNPVPYGKISYLRQYRGPDLQGRQVKFYILTIVSPDGGGLHIVSGAPAGKFEPAYERYAKLVADSVEFIH
jgi:hypothetical protein